MICSDGVVCIYMCLCVTAFLNSQSRITDYGLRITDYSLIPMKRCDACIDWTMFDD
jgi:hypothetical protein